MSLQNGRYTASKAPHVANGWSLEPLTPPSRLYGANGLRTGPDGRIYVAQVAGSQISALDVATGAIETITAMGSDVGAPDDTAFDAQGNLYITEYYDGRVSVRETSGKTRVLRDDVPGANGITVHKDRLFVDECRPWFSRQRARLGRSRRGRTDRHHRQRSGLALSASQE
ncbi:MAG: hypothetical protein RLZZ450_2109 [Pseudomonadota bacterium]|jgi:sugar lactone lactonase YvrE